MSDYELLREQMETQEETDSKDNNVRRSLESVFEIFNPFEALGEGLSDPEFGLMLLLGIAVIVIAALVLFGLWSVVQEAFCGAGPPQSLGLK